MTAIQDAPAARMAGVASLALVRVFIWETNEYAVALGRHLQAAGHPFVVRRREQLPQSFAQSCAAAGRGGLVFELFTLPIELGAVLDALHLEETERDLETGLDLSELPALLLRRKRRPADPDHPEREFRRILQHLPTWQPESQPQWRTEAALDDCPLDRPFRNPALRAPFICDDEDDALEFAGGSRARCR